jgi:hypothetical protein
MQNLKKAAPLQNLYYYYYENPLHPLLKPMPTLVGPACSASPEAWSHALRAVTEVGNFRWVRVETQTAALFRFLFFTLLPVCNKSHRPGEKVKSIASLALFSLLENKKVFKISRHVESCDTFIKY